MSEPTSTARETLPIPDRPYDGPVYEDAKDPDAKFPPIEPLRPPAGAPNVLIVLLDDVGFGCSSAFGGPVPDADGRAPGGRGAQVHPLPHDGAVLADARGAALGPQPPHGRHGRDHRDRDVGAGLQLDPPEHLRAARRDAEAQRLLDRAVRQVPRGAGVGDEPARPVRLVAERRRRLRVLLRLHRRRDEPVLPGALRGHDAGRAGPDAGGGLPLHRGHDRQGDQVDPPAEGADAGQAVLRLLRARRDPRAAPRARGVVGEVQGQVRPGLGHAARGDVRAAEGARRDPARRRADRPARGDPRVGRHPRRPEAGAGAADGGLRRLPRAHRPPRRPARRRARRPRRSSTTRSSTTSSATTARAPRATSTAASTRWSSSTARPRLETTEFMVSKIDDVRHPGGVQPLRRRLGARDGHAVSVDEAGRVALGRHAQRHDRALAERHRGEGRGPQPVPPRDRRRPDRARGGRPARAEDGERRRAEADRGREHALRLRRRRRGGAPRDAVLRDVLQPRASTTRAGPRSRATRPRG